MNAKLKEAFSAIEALPDDEQEAIARALLVEAANFGRSALNAEQIAIVKDRLARPIAYASDDQVRRVVGNF